MFSEPIVFLIVFSGLLSFLIFLFGQISRDKIDVFDALSISFVLLVPLVFLLFEGLFMRISDLIGVKFPFVMMFGLLFLISFFINFRLIVRINKLKNELVRLSQVVAIEAGENEKRGIR